MRSLKCLNILIEWLTCEASLVKLIKRSFVDSTITPKHNICFSFSRGEISTLRWLGKRNRSRQIRRVDGTHREPETAGPLLFTAQLTQDPAVSSQHNLHWTAAHVCVERKGKSNRVQSAAESKNLLHSGLKLLNHDGWLDCLPTDSRIFAPLWFFRHPSTFNPPELSFPVDIRIHFPSFLI
ncbi:hypothetical protein IRJ41_006987 [Triplophysa rosa]|uniref:Uncharacterized protein n=1 Tax=Triplophysa rosa TaxID=992332 RepID=A0A9W8C100_TRIRA|nr:hypothetical protein IRJ41_006987 [Triplophysa rosa]